MDTQKSLNSQSMLRNKKGAGGINFPEFRLYYKATIIKTVQYQQKLKKKKKHTQKYRPIEQDRESMLSMGTLVVTKEARIYSGAKIASSIRDAGKTRQLCAKGGHQSIS